MTSRTKTGHPHPSTGKQAEDKACDFLIRQGLKLLTRNYRCRCGEIDLIMQDTEHLVFVEVRYRRNRFFGSGAESVDGRKQRKLINTALLYLQKHGNRATQASRFDVISIGPGRNEHGGMDLDILWIQDAFQA